MINEYKFFLSEMMLVKIDRASMANSLEVRSPFLDHKLIEYVVSRFKNVITSNPKKPLKQFLASDFDNEFLSRKKWDLVLILKIGSITILTRLKKKLMMVT